MLSTGVIGLGMIGGGVAICLARANGLSAVFDVRPDAADKLPGVPACLSSVAELASQCNVIIIAVVSADQVRGVLNGPDGVLANAKKDLIIVLQSTLSLPDLKDITNIANASGVTVVDCGVSGGQQAAENGLVSLVGAEDAIFKRIKPVLEGYSKTVAHMGGPGAGMAAKIARNVIVYNVWRAGYEGALLAEAAGVDVRKLAAAIDSSAEGVGGPTTWMTRASEPEQDPQEKALREHVLTMLDKDLSAALELAGDVDVNLPMAELAKASAKTMLRIKD
jgi:3-hydroxyisobutyrate dehydrogenase